MSQLYWLELWGPIVMLPGSTPAGGELLIPVTKVGTGPSGSGKNLPGEAGPLPNHARDVTSMYLFRKYCINFATKFLNSHKIYWFMKNKFDCL